MKVAIGQINPTVGDLVGNANKIIEYVENAKTKGAELIVFPELSVIGYPPKDLLYNPDFLHHVEIVLNDIVNKIHDIYAIIGVVTTTGDGFLRNSAVLVRDGRIVDKADKTLLPNYDVFDESRYFIPSNNIHCINIKGLKVGVSICEDIWNDKDFWERPRYNIDVTEELVKEDPAFFINISASPYNYKKYELRSHMISKIAEKYHKPIIYVNQVGGNDELLFDGSSFVVNAKGDITVQAGSFKEDFMVFDIENLDNGECINVNEDISWIYNALVMGIKDYTAKTGFKKVAIGLSGGIDSAVTCCLAVEALGKENVLGVSMPSRYSSEGSKSDARILAENLGIEFRTYPIEDVFKAYLKVFNGDGEPLKDLAEENIQARIRGNYLMFLSNRENRLVLTTGNKSELAMGYCTLYGDMAGGLAVISDVPKTMVYELARYINRDRQIIPESTLTKPPSAELRPDQKDVDSLPPYEILDVILKAYIEDEKSIDEIVSMGYSEDLVRDIMKKVNRAEYKRRQAAPGLKVTTKAFGIGRRMPIAQRWL
ncbi:NAD+ synthase (glutamine-hydrolysing) [Caldanaerobius fijiensis DSM 17918]|uniref:Glutamine-dependent NAD(+) synthetase n=1 Tax=Caldanaerobius fijiensis DSM 17918 TaxID=1121256 RepID=A0A1M4VEB5_9THEO|nr:NAD+ synthase [Caldanaerobius fijiensis]SHE67193.1 NAD+ synthase (glutamine-hydrolysing) [Caldanaerobius fijiensis DSM 17918]